MLENINSAEFLPLRDRLANLSVSPPQAMLIEGGSETQRMEMALYWAMLANCGNALESRAAGGHAGPCLECAVCGRIAANADRDLLIYDGRISNKQDEDNPGPIRALRMENVREMKAATGTKPTGAGKRVVILQGMGTTREEALNCLLKTLEEPSPYTLFVLLTPQREQILATLVSRSFCFTLPWLDSRYKNNELIEWEEALALFLGSGTGFLDKISVKGALDANIAAQIILSCQKSLARAAGGEKTELSPLDKYFRKFARSQENISLLRRWLTEAQKMLASTVNPVRAIEAFCANLFVLERQGHLG